MRRASGPCLARPTPLRPASCRRRPGPPASAAPPDSTPSVSQPLDVSASWADGTPAPAAASTLPPTNGAPAAPQSPDGAGAPRAPAPRVTTLPAADDDVSLAALLRFTLPTAAIWVTGPVLGLVDSSVVGLRSSLQLAALGPGTVVVDYASYVFTFLANAVQNAASLLFARGDGDGASAMLSDAVGLAALLGAALGAWMWWCGPPAVAALAGPASAGVVPHAVTYVRWRALAAPAALVSFAVQAFFLAARNTAVPLAAALAAAAANLVFDVALVCGAGWGIGGAAAATVAAQLVATAWLVARLGRPVGGAAPAGWTPALEWRLPSRAAAAAFLKFAGPVVALLGAKVALYTYLSRVAAAGGPAAAAAHHLAISAFLLFACAGDAVSAGAQAWLPAAIGDPRRARRVAAALLRAGATAGAANVAVVGAALAASPRLFTGDAAVAAALRGVAPVVAVTLGLHTASMATEGMLLAGRDLAYQAAANLLNCATVVAAVRWASARGGPPAWLPGGGGGGTLHTVWAALCLFQGLRLALNGARLWASPRSPLARTDRLQVA